MPGVTFPGPRWAARLSRRAAHHSYPRFRRRGRAAAPTSMASGHGRSRRGARGPSWAWPP